MSVIIHDQFTGMASGDDIGGRTPSPVNIPGNTWTHRAANTVEGDGSNRIKVSAANDDAVIETGVTYMKVTCDFDPLGINNRGWIFGAVDGLQTAGGMDGYALLFQPNIDTMVIQKWNAGVNTAISNTSSAGNSDLLNHTYRLTISDAGVGSYAIEMFMDGVSKGAVTDSTTTPGTKAGIQHTAYTSGGGRYDNFIVENMINSLPPSRPKTHMVIR